MEHDLPILEHDGALEAVTKPHVSGDVPVLPDHAVGCFSQKAVDAFVSENSCSLLYNLSSNMGKHPVYQVEGFGKPVALFQPGLGAPFAAAFMEELIALGCRKFIVCGSCGVLDGGIAKGSLIIPTSAVRDEGTSYHYLPPGRESAPTLRVISLIEDALTAHKCQFTVGKTWTTDGFYRETHGRVKRRRDEGCLVVEMEAAALFAVAQFRQVEIGQILSGSDDVGGEIWDLRKEHIPLTGDEKLLRIAIEICAAM